MGRGSRAEETPGRRGSADLRGESPVRGGDSRSAGATTAPRAFRDRHRLERGTDPRARRGRARESGAGVPAHSGGRGSRCRRRGPQLDRPRRIVLAGQAAIRSAAGHGSGFDCRPLQRAGHTRERGWPVAGPLPGDFRLSAPARSVRAAARLRPALRGRHVGPRNDAGARRPERADREPGHAGVGRRAQGRGHGDERGRRAGGEPRPRGAAPRAGPQRWCSGDCSNRRATASGPAHRPLQHLRPPRASSLGSDAGGARPPARRGRSRRVRGTGNPRASGAT